MPDVKHKHWWILRKNFFWSWATSPPTIAPQSVYIKYIYCVFFEVAITSKWSCPTSIFFHFLKLLCLLSNIYFEARERIKTRWDTPIWIWVSKISVFCTRKRLQLLHLRDIYHADVIVEVVFVYKNRPFLIVKFKWVYLSEFLSPRKLRNIC